MEGDRNSWYKWIDEIHPLVAPADKLYQDSDFAKTKDYVKSTVILNRLEGRLREIGKLVSAYVDLSPELRNAKAAVKELEDHDGESGVAEQIARLNNDLSFAESKGSAFEYVAATNICKNVLKLSAEAKIVAEQCKAYLDAHESVTEALKEFDTATTFGTEQNEANEARTWISKAEGLATSKKWVEALAAIEQANARCKRAKATADNANWLENSINDVEPDLENLPAGWGNAWSKYEGMLSHRERRWNEPSRRNPQ